MKQERKNIYRLILVQVIGLTLVSLLVAGITTPHTAISVLLGGTCCLLPTFYFAHQLFRQMGARAAYLTVQTLYVGELVKLVFMGCLCIFVFKFIPIHPLAFFLGFLATQFMFWCAPAIYKLRAQSVRGTA
jgi:F0F1-type ATP synthase assembly protein I